jgi:hypothetical protein
LSEGHEITLAPIVAARLQTANTAVARLSRLHQQFLLGFSSEFVSHFWVHDIIAPDKPTTVLVRSAVLYEWIYIGSCGRQKKSRGLRSGKRKLRAAASGDCCPSRLEKHSVAVTMPQSCSGRVDGPPRSTLMEGVLRAPPSSVGIIPSCRSYCISEVISRSFPTALIFFFSRKIRC